MLTDHYNNSIINYDSTFPRPGTRIPQPYFIDRLEVETTKLWNAGFYHDFEAVFGYDITTLQNKKRKSQKN